MNKRRSKLVLKTKPNRMLSIASKINLIYFRFEGDTCTALEDFQQDPYNSSLSSILPCNELLSAKSVLSDVGAGIYDLVNEVKLRTEIFVLFFWGYRLVTHDSNHLASLVSVFRSHIQENTKTCVANYFWV